MAEFGENLRKAREKKGITQQTLADQIYVTRQAVSRWEGGSRYPDLMTAKKLAALLGTTLDELVRDDDLHRLPEVNPVIEYPLTKRIQTAIFTACLVPSLMWVVWYIISWVSNGFGTVEEQSLWRTFSMGKTVLYYGLLTALFAYGVYMSVKDNLTPRIFSVIAGVFFGEIILERVVNQLLFSITFATGKVLYAAALLTVDIAALVIMLLYFSGRRLTGPKPVYAVSLFYITETLVVWAARIRTVLKGSIEQELMGYYTYTLLGGLLRVFLRVSLLLLLAYMARELAVKRRIGRAVPSQAGEIPPSGSENSQNDAC